MSIPAEQNDYIQGFKDNNYQLLNEELEIIYKHREDQQKLKKDMPTTDHNLVGLALSGGGIRSATFNLGFLQALSVQGYLKCVDYLSTVSGGGYIGSSLTTLLNSSFNDLKDNDLEGKDTPDLLADEHFPFSFRYYKNDNDDRQTIPQSPEKKRLNSGKEKKPVKHLRYYSNYLTTEGNFIHKYFSPAVVMARGVVLNFFLLIPYILILGYLLSLFFKIPPVPLKNGNDFYVCFNLKAYENALESQRAAEDELRTYVLTNTRELSHLSYEDRKKILSSTAPDIELKEKKLEATEDSFKKISRSIWHVPLWVFAIMVLFNLLCLNKCSASFKDRFKLSKFLCILIFFFSVVPLIANLFGMAIVYWGVWKIPPGVSFISILTFLAPKLLSSNATSAKPNNMARIAISGVLFSLAPLFLLFCVGVVINYANHHVWIIGLILGTLALGKAININKISLHTFYRDRLSRAYLIQRNPEDKDTKAQFDSIRHKDDLKMSELTSNLPYHIINTNLNLSKKPPVGKAGQYLQGEFRNGESFVFTRNWCGSEKTGYRKTKSYEDDDTHLNLGTAMAISGAAVNIGMAQGNLPVFRMLFGLLNIRLGYWALNPDPKLTKSMLFKKKWKYPSSLTLLKEMVGKYSMNGKFINLSDGGHFDNIGVYELLRRRCKYIIVGDAEADPKMRFQALSYLLRLARIDFGIDIDIDVSDIKIEKETGFSRNYCSVGIINYPAFDGMKKETGYLLYCKSSFIGDEPQHLHEYRAKHPDFPHQTTADQWFDEQQFEAYRELGYQVGKKVFQPATYKADRNTLEANFIRFKEFWHPHCTMVETYFTKHTQALNQILNQVKNDKDLVFMDAQMFPGWDELISGTVGKPTQELWLPHSFTAVRKSFYVCNMMIQLMENVYLDLHFEKYHDHPDNRGWMNLFRHWSWVGIFRVTWAVSACSFGARFQVFCREKLDMDIGNVEIEDLTKKLSGHTHSRLTHFTDRHAIEVSGLLNEYEVLMIERLINVRKVFPTQIISFYLVVKDPLDETKQKKFGFGFALLVGDKIAYFRIQDQFRNMGLGREALIKMLSELNLQKATLDHDVVKNYKDIAPSDDIGQIDRELMRTDLDMFTKTLESAKEQIDLVVNPV